MVSDLHFHTDVTHPSRSHHLLQPKQALRARNQEHKQNSKRNCFVALQPWTAAPKTAAPPKYL